MMQIRKYLQTVYQKLYQIREELHTHPELGYEEHGTTERIADFLESYNISFIPFENTTGGYVFLNNEKSTTIAFRGDIDALPILEETGISFHSKNEGVMHACGHDVHTTIALGLCLVLHHFQKELKTNVVIIFQPAEECNPTGGAKLVIQEGIFEKYNISQIYGIHNWPSYPLGTIGIKTGTQMGSSDSFLIQVYGKSAHAAEPHKGIDAITIGIDIVNSIEHNLRREIDPFDTALVSVGEIVSTGRYNVVCDYLEIRGTVRTTSESVRTFIHQRIAEMATSISESYRGKVQVGINEGYHSLRNEPRITKPFIAYATEVLGEEQVITTLHPSLIGEDFSAYSQVADSLYFFLGSESEYPLHSSKMMPKKEVINIGIELFAHYFLESQHFQKTLYL